MSTIEVQPLTPADRAWVTDFGLERWGAETVVGHGTVYYPATLPGFVASLDGERVGLVTYVIDGESCEIVTIDSTRPLMGVGTALLKAVKAAAGDAGCTRVWLITTNDNLTALRFYQRRGFVLTALYRNALEKSRELKPEIPRIGEHGIPIRDELELELRLS